MTKSWFKSTYERNAFIKEINSLYWRPPGGESIADVRLRVRNLFDTLHRECAGQSVIIVTHVEFMWAARAELEYMTDERWVELERDPSQKMNNTQILQYSRKNPVTGEIRKNFGWRRSICPWKDSIDAEWIPIERKRFTNEELLEQVNKIEPVFSLI